MKRIYLSIFFLVSTLLLTFAQDNNSKPSITSNGSPPSGNTGSGAFYDYGAGGYTIDVNIWGFVNRPGKYRVPSSTLLIQLISYAGGPTERARLEDIRILHDITTDSTIKEPVVIYNIDEYKKTGNPKLNPLLYYADTIIVQGDAINLLEKTLQIAGSIATTILAVLALVSYFTSKN